MTEQRLDIRYECLWCDRDFYTQEGLRRHVESEGEYPHSVVKEDEPEEDFDEQ